MNMLDARLSVRRDRFALEIAVTAAPGEVIAVMGPSGAGKSTLLDALAGFVPLVEGYVRLGSEEISARQPNERGIVLLRQEPHLFPHLSVRENVAFGARAQGASRMRARDDAERWLERVGLEGFAARRPATLSGGQQQRVALARALAASPRLILLDEPLAALDPETAVEIRSILGDQLRTTRVTTVIVTHEIADARALADRLIVLEKGAATHAGTVTEVLAGPRTPFVEVLSGVHMCSSCRRPIGAAGHTAE